VELERAVLEHIEARLRSELGFRTVRAEHIQPWQAHTNRLLHLWAADGREAVAKVYIQDGRFRLEREFSTLSFLHKQGIPEVPIPLLCNVGQGWAVYSFEAGEAHLGTELAPHHLEKIASFAAKLHRLHPDPPVPSLRTSFAATFSLAALTQSTCKAMAQRLQAAPSRIERILSS